MLLLGNKDDRLLNNFTKSALEVVDSDKIKIGVLSDTRPVSGHIWPEMLSEMASIHKPDVIVNGGDFTDWSLSGEYASYVEKLNTFDILSLHVIGNHDDRLFGPRHFAHYFGDWDLSIEMKHWKIIIVRNTWRFGYGFKSNQIDWLKQELDTTLKTCVFTHAPIKQLFDDNLEANPNIIKKMVDDKGATVLHMADLTFFGHAHLFAHKAINGNHYFISGGGAPNLFPCKRTAYSWSINHGMMLELSSNGYLINMIRRGGDIHPEYQYVALSS
ncbi:MAG: hypothetical protein GF411_14505 [Candidatus Lokiarchaeota archaeon]|nr:hypothetical protein [Candidatus Lokiarchaeota archaeon]